MLKQCGKTKNKGFIIILLFVLLPLLTGCGRIEEERISEESGLDSAVKFEAEELLDACLAGEIPAIDDIVEEEYMIFDWLSDDGDDFSYYSVGERIDLDNDGENEQILNGPYGGIYLDARDGKVYVLARGEGTTGVLFYTKYENATWIVHSDTTHAGRQMYWLTRYDGEGNIVGEFQFSAEYWDSPDDEYDENSDFTYRDKKISMEEYEALEKEIFGSLTLSEDEDTSIRVWLDEQRTESAEGSEGMEGFEWAQREVFGNNGHAVEYESREALLSDFGFEDSEPMYQYYDISHNILLKLYGNREKEKFCGISYSYHFDNNKIVEMSGFTINSLQEQKWEERDAFDVKTIYGDVGADYVDDYEETIEYTPSGKPDYYLSQGVTDDFSDEAETIKVIEISHVYRDDDTLFYREYWHNPNLFGSTTYRSEDGWDEYSLIYVDDNDVPELYFFTGGMAYGEIIVSFYDGKVRAMNRDRIGIAYMEYGGLLYSNAGKAVTYPCNVYMLEKGEFSEIGTGWYREHHYDEELQEIIYSYFWEDSPVTEAEFEAHINELIDTINCIEPPVLYTRDEILEILCSK